MVGCERELLTTRAVSAAALLLRGVEAVSRVIVGRASGVAFTASLGASVASTTVTLLGDVAVSITASKAQA